MPFTDIVTDLPAGGENSALGPLTPREQLRILRGRDATEGASDAGQVMMTLGSVAFGTLTGAYQQLKRSTEFRWPAQDRVGRRPSRQSTGTGRDSVTLEGVIMPSWRGSAAAVDALRALGARGEPQLLTAGDGTVFGRWVLLRVEETRSGLFADGAARKIAFAAELAHYGDDSPSGRATATEEAAEAAGDVRSVVDAAGDAAAGGGSPADVLAAATAAAARAAAGLGGPAGSEGASDTGVVGSASNPRRVLDAIAGVAARGGSARGMIDAAVRAASRLPGAAAPVAAVARDVAYRARAGDVIDDIAWRRYGTPLAAAAILAANPRLAEHDPRLPAGTLVGLPERAAETAARTIVQLWT